MEWVHSRENEFSITRNIQGKKCNPPMKPQTAIFLTFIHFVFLTTKALYFLLLGSSLYLVFQVEAQPFA